MRVWNYYFVFINYMIQECTPVGCVPSAAVAVSLVMHTPQPQMPLCHAHPPATHAPCHATHATLPHMPPLPCTLPCLACSPPCTPCHAYPLPCTPPTMHAPLQCTPPVDRMTDACENITFLQLLLRTVNICHICQNYNQTSRSIL